MPVKVKVTSHRKECVIHLISLKPMVTTVIKLISYRGVIVNPNLNWDHDAIRNRPKPYKRSTQQLYFVKF